MDEPNGIFKMIIFFVTLNGQFLFAFIKLLILLHSLQAEAYTFSSFNFFPFVQEEEIYFQGLKKKNLVSRKKKARL